MVTAGGLSLPATVQHFLVWRDPDHFFGAGKPFGSQLLTYDRQTLAAMDFLQTDAHSGDVVLTTENQMPGADRLFCSWVGCTKRLHAQGDRRKEVLERLAIGKS